MEGREHSFSFSLGTWWQTHVRVSWFFPLILLVFWSRMELPLALTCVLLLLVSVIVHEFFHVFGARLTGGEANEILIWPAGGLAYTQPGPSFRSEFLTIAAGPLANVLMALLMLPVVLSAGQLDQVWHPIVLPHVELNEHILRDWGVLLFALNVKLVYINLLPVLPLDGGRMLQVILSRSYDPRIVHKVGLWTGIAVAFVMALVGFWIAPENGISLVSLAALVFCMNYIEMIKLTLREQFGGMGSEFGYDFSEGYSSLDADEPQRRPGMIEQWKAGREAKRRERDAAERAAEETRLDALLDKVHQHGMDSLTPSEQRFLKQASERRSGRK
jgi:stage IV sporulation protein FB